MGFNFEYLWNPDAPMRQYLDPKIRRKAGAPDTSAEDLYAYLTKRSWYDYMNTLGVPQENQLIDYASNPQVVTDAMKEAGQDATQAFDRQTLNTARRLSSLGLSLTPEEQASADRSTSLARSLADVGSQNRARDQTIARQQAVLGNPAPQIGAIR